VFECWKEIEAYGSIRSFRSSLSVPNGVLGHRFLGVKSGVRAQWGFGSQLLQIRSNPRCRHVMVEIDVKVYVMLQGVSVGNVCRVRDKVKRKKKRKRLSFSVANLPRYICFGNPNLPFSHDAKPSHVARAT
jgi:hypothetical protein